ncbi:MAG: thiosulfate oxidation carrier protein SoxY [Gammaproteobacteria bacterium]|nr:thiosulfate oxidation carrier protein SoxY [Gammaproteobacteria bacterium]
MNETRRVFLKGSLAAGAVGVAVGAGLLTPRSILAAWPQSAFEAKSVDAALSAAVGSDKTEASSDITVKAPDIAENGAVVPITVSTGMAGASMIALIAEQNATPLTSTFELGEGTEAFISTRIKMGKTSNVLAIVKADGKLYSAKKEVKVTIGGCGG